MEAFSRDYSKAYAWALNPRRTYDWNREDCPEFYEQTIEAVNALGGQFWTAGGAPVTSEHPDASWYVPTAGYQPVMMKKKNGLWSARGF